MKKRCFLLLLTAVVFAPTPEVRAAGRRVFITRHGQQGDGRYFDAAVSEMKLTPLGEKQADLLAHYLKERCGFAGTILVSPLYRTIQTGLPLARLLGKNLILEPGIQEMSVGKTRPRAMTFAEIDARFPGMTVRGPAFVEPWRVFDEDTAARRERTGNAMRRILAENPGDLLLVAHGATIVDLTRWFDLQMPREKAVYCRGWNCCVIIYFLDDNDVPTGVFYTTEHLPDELVTDNFRCPKLERPGDPRYAPRQRTESERAARWRAEMELERR